MRNRFAVFLLLFSQISHPLFAEVQPAPQPFLSLGGTGSISMDAIFPGANVYNFRAGISLDGHFVFVPSLGFGIEGGMAISLTNPYTSVSFVDIPIRALVTVRAGGFVLQPFGGIFLIGFNDGGTQRGTAFGTGWEAGIRIGLGETAFPYIECGYVFGSPLFLRIGLGIRAGLWNLYQDGKEIG